MSYRLRPATRQRRCPQMNTLSRAQKEQFQALVRTYTPDLHDAVVVEVLLVLIEVCRILDLLPSDIEQLFSPSVLQRVRCWNGVIVQPLGRQTQQGQLQRVWVWRPEWGEPQVLPVAPSGTIRLCKRVRPQSRHKPPQKL